MRKMTDWKSWVPADRASDSKNVNVTAGLPTITSQVELSLGGLDVSSTKSETNNLGKPPGKPPMAPLTETGGKDGGATSTQIEDEFEMFEMDEDFDGAGGDKTQTQTQPQKDEDLDEDYGDDTITDEDIGRLMIVTSRGGRGGGQAGRPRRVIELARRAPASGRKRKRHDQRGLEVLPTRTQGAGRRRPGRRRRRELEARRRFERRVRDDARGVVRGCARDARGELRARRHALLPFVVQGEWRDGERGGARRGRYRVVARWDVARKRARCGGELAHRGGELGGQRFW